MLLFIHRQGACAASPAPAHVALGVLGGHVPQSEATFSEHGFSWLMQVMIIIRQLSQIVLLILFLLL